MNAPSHGHTIRTTDAAPAIADICAQIEKIHAEAADLVNRIADQRDRCLLALALMVEAHRKLCDDTEGKYPPLDPGCIECTCGATPNRYNTGRCAYHIAVGLLAEFPLRKTT
jgi:hypothetical protein